MWFILGIIVGISSAWGFYVITKETEIKKSLKNQALKDRNRNR